MKSAIFYRYLDCRELHYGFARVKCKDCNHEYLPASAATFALPAKRSIDLPEFDEPAKLNSCRGIMRIIGFIEDRDVIKTILKNLGLWLIRSKPPTKDHAPPVREYAADGFCHSALSFVRSGR